MKEIPANKRKVPEEPSASVNDRNVSLTIRFDIQLATAAIPPPKPLYLNGYISEFTIQGIVPIPGEYNMMYNPSRRTANIPNLLGQPSTYHVRSSPRHESLMTSVFARHAPGLY